MSGAPGARHAATNTTVLLAIARQNAVPLIGLNWKDEDDAAIDWLEQLGNPYTVVAVDRDGRTAIDFGVYGAPETFFIDADGRVQYRHVGADDAPRSGSASSCRACRAEHCHERVAQRFAALARCCCVAVARRVVAVDVDAMPTPELQERYDELTHELRCMQCQNQSIADSPVGLASDLRRDVREQLIAGKTDAEIRESMVARYGNVILFRPPFKPGTAWVWIAPFAVAAGRRVRRACASCASAPRMVASDDSVDRHGRSAAMMLAFVLIAGIAGRGRGRAAAVAAHAPRADARPAAALAAGGVLFVLLLGGGGLYAAFSNYSWVETPVVGGNAGGDGREAREAAGAGARRSRRLAACWAAPTRRSSSFRWPCAPISAPTGSRKARTPKPSSASPNRCSRRTSSSCAAPPGQLFERALEIEPDNPKALLYSAFAALGRGEPRPARERFTAHAGAQSAAADPRHHRETAIAIDGAARARSGVGPALRAGGREGGGARHAGARARGQGAGGRAAVRRGPRSEAAGAAVRRQAAAGDVSRSTSSCPRPTPCSRRAASPPGSNSKSSRASPSGEHRPRPAATRSDKLAIMWARTEG